MTVALIVIGLLAGAYLHGFFGALAGAAAGCAIAVLLSLKERVAALEDELAGLKRQLLLRGQEAAAKPERAAADAARAPSPPRDAGPPPAAEETFTFEEITEDTEEQQRQSGTGPNRSGDGISQPTGAALESVSVTAADTLSNFLTGGSLVVKIGIVILFFGVSFLIKYAAEHDLLPIELRLTGAAAGGVALLAIGWRLRKLRDTYAQVLQGGGIGILYLTTFAALRLYSLIPTSLAFFVLVAVALLSAVLAVAQNARSLAVMGATGGFLAPILTSTGGGSHVVLFSYYALLNGAIVGIAWFRAWRILNLLGFAFTFSIGAFWGFQYYRPQYFPTTEPFLLLFFVMYVAISVLFALRQAPDLKGCVDGTLVFGTPLAAFALQAMLVESRPYGLAWSAFAFGLLYLFLSRILSLTKSAHMKALVEAFLAFGVVFVTLAIPLAFDNRWTSAAWALEGAGILWSGTGRRRKLSVYFGALLLFGSGAAFIFDGGVPAAAAPVLNSYFLGGVLIAVSGLFASFCLYRNRQLLGKRELSLGAALFIWGMLWWFGAGLREIDQFVSFDYRLGGTLLFFAGSCTVCDYLEKRLSWNWQAWPALLLLPFLIYTALSLSESGMHPFSEWGLVGWPVAIAASYRILYHHERLPGELLKLLHAGSVWLVAGIAVLEMQWQLGNRIAAADTWPLISWGLAPALLVLCLAKYGRRLRWPVNEHPKTYLYYGAGPVAVAAWLWTLYVNVTSPGDSHPLPYLPLLNPLDMTVGMVFGALALWFARLRDDFPGTPPVLRAKMMLGVFGASTFLWVNAILIRSYHQWSGVPFAFSPLFSSILLQALLAVFWTLLALCAMVAATRKGLRQLWFAGAGLLAVVVVKLFAVDLANSGTIERIISFVAVGILLLIIGYASPAPPRINSGTGRTNGDL